MSDDNGTPKLPKIGKNMTGMTNLKGRPKKNGTGGNGTTPLKPKMTFVQPGDTPPANESAAAPPVEVTQGKTIPVQADDPLPACDRQTFRTVKYIKAGVLGKDIHGKDTVDLAVPEFPPTSTLADFHKWLADENGNGQWIELYFMNDKGEIVDRRECDFRGLPPPKLSAEEKSRPGTSGQPPPPPPRIIKESRGSGRKNGVSLEKFQPDETAIPDDLDEQQRREWIMRSQIRREQGVNFEHMSRLVLQTSADQAAALGRAAERILSDTGINDRVAQGLREDLAHARLEKAQIQLTHTQQMDAMFKMLAEQRKDATDREERLRGERDKLRTRVRELEAVLETNGAGGDFISEVLKGFGKEKAGKALEVLAARAGLLPPGPATAAAAPAANGVSPAALGAGAVAAGGAVAATNPTTTPGGL